MQFLLNQCHSAFTQYPGVMLTLFFAGLVGGLTHCAGMCGPFVAAQIQPGTAGQTHLQRLRGAALLPYHLGRMTTYISLGVIAALLSKQVIGTPVQHWAAIILLSLAGAIFIASAVPQVKRWLHVHRSQHTSVIGDMLARAAKPFFHNPTGLRGYVLGVLLGFLPCGLIFAALMIVATTGNILTAALAMAVFTLATFPALFLVGLGSQFVYRKWPNTTQKLVRGVMVLNGVSLFAMAGAMIL